MANRFMHLAAWRWKKTLFLCVSRKRHCVETDLSLSTPSDDDARERERRGLSERDARLAFKPSCVSLSRGGGGGVFARRELFPKMKKEPF